MRIISSIRSLLPVLVIFMVSGAAFAQIGIAITLGPPALPVYEQPPCPADGYLWTPGYWAYDYDSNDYYWVPGAWVEPPEVGFLWTPGYWGWGGDRFIFHEGYWGPHVGFYGGIAYGYGYFGEGYEGGRWDNGRFFYNRSVNNVNIVNVHNVYNTTVINRVNENRISYNGGNGGINARPRPEDQIAERDRHIAPIAVQTQHMQESRANPQMRSNNFNRRPENNVPRPPNATHAADLQPHPRPAPPNTGNAKQDQKYQQQQEKLYAKQQQDHQKLQQKQEQDHQRLAQQNANDARKQQVEQKHQQQTQQMEQRHAQQSERMQSRQGPGRGRP